MILTNTPEIPGRDIEEILGIVRGNTVRARHLGSDILAGLRNVVGGEIAEYTKVLAEAREQALDRMRDHAVALGADAVVNVRFVSAEIARNAAEVLVYGTAVKLVPDD